MPPSLSSLAPELHHLIVAALPTCEFVDNPWPDAGYYSHFWYRGPGLVPDVKTIAKLSQTCTVLYNNVHWMLFDACAKHSVLSGRARRYALTNSQPKVLGKLASAGVAFDVDVHGALRHRTRVLRPLQIAANMSDLAVARKLVEIHGLTQAAAEVYRKEFTFSWSPLEMAAASGNLEMVRLLASPSILHYRTDSDSEIVKEIPGRALVHASGTPPAARRHEGHIQVMKLLIEEHGVDVHFNLGRSKIPSSSPIQEAVHWNDSESFSTAQTPRRASVTTKIALRSNPAFLCTWR